MNTSNNKLALGNFQDYTSALIRFEDLIKMENLCDKMKKEKATLHALIEKYQIDN
jgi:hypothetical protein